MLPLGLITSPDHAQGCKPQLLPFPPYTCAQIGAVVRARLSQLPGKVFTPPAMMLCARKVRLAGFECSRTLTSTPP
jgi:hypothetical protein